MTEEQNKGRWFLIRHKCGGMFTMSTSSIIDSFQTDYQLRCPGCFHTIGNEIKAELKNFCTDYERVIKAFQKENYEISEMEINNEDSNS